jgi:hypothetical protein
MTIRRWAREIIGLQWQVQGETRALQWLHAGWLLERKRLSLDHPSPVPASLQVD